MLVVVPAAVSSNAGSLADSELVAGREVKLPWAGCAFEEAIWSWTLGLESARRCKGSKHLDSALCQCLLTWKGRHGRGWRGYTAIRKLSALSGVSCAPTSARFFELFQE
jgi:hypothetical protein